MDQTFFCTHNFFLYQKLFSLNFFLSQNILWTTHFFGPQNLFGLKKNLDSGPGNYLNQNFYWAYIFSTFLVINFKTFQAKHFRHQSWLKAIKKLEFDTEDQDLFFLIFLSITKAVTPNRSGFPDHGPDPDFFEQIGPDL